MSAAGSVVSDSSALIALQQIKQLALLQRLFGKVVVPPAVAREIAQSVTLPVWIEQVSLSQARNAEVARAALGAGESEAIRLALETEARLIILDDRPARRLAQSLGLPIIGTLGILLTAKRHNLLPELRPALECLSVWALMGREWRWGWRLASGLQQVTATA